jgi:hypothetical protein
MSQLDQRKVLVMILKILGSRMPFTQEESVEDYPLIWAAAGIINSVIGSSQARKSHLIAWLTDATGAGLGEGCGIRRAAIAAISEDKDAIVAVLEKSLNQFGDQLYIAHSPILQQEGKEVDYARGPRPANYPSSARPSTFIKCWICPPTLPDQVNYIASDRQLSQCYIESDRSFTRKSKVPRNGCWGSPVWTCTQW